jgi:hypothetical protein
MWHEVVIAACRRFAANKLRALIEVVWTLPKASALSSTSAFGALCADGKRGVGQI